MDPNPTTAATSSESSLSPDVPFTVNFWIYGNYRTTVIMARPYNVTFMVVPQNTVGQVLDSLREYMPGCTRYLHVVFDGQQLPREATIGGLRLPRDANLHVTPYPEAWSLAYQIGAEYTELFNKYRDSGALGLFPHRDVLGARYHIHASCEIVPLVKKFLQSASTVHEKQAPYRAEMIDEYLDVVAGSGLVAFLVDQYLSNSLCHIRANESLRYLLWPHSLLAGNVMGLPVVEEWTAPLCVEVCQRIASIPGNDKSDPLYKFSRLRLATVFPLLRLPNSPDLPRDWLIEKLIPFAQETADEVIGYIAEGRAVSCALLYEFRIFFSVLCWAVRTLRAESSPGGRAGETQQIAALSKKAMSLLKAVDEFMARLARDLPPSWPWSKLELPDWATNDLVRSVWDVLTKLNSWSEVHGQVADAMRATLTARAASLNVLVQGTSIAWCRQGNIRWIVAKHKDLLGFEARRRLAIAMLPELDDDLGLPLSSFIIDLPLLIDRTQLLPDSFAYVAEAPQHELHAGLDVEFIGEEAIGRGVLKEWLTLLCQALFNPQQALFSPCPRDGRRFFLNPASAVNPQLLQHLDFAGRIIGLALAHNVQVGICLDRTLFLQLARRPVTLDDIADADPITLASCRKILEMDPDLVDALGLTFAREVEVLGSRQVIELLPGGRDVAVGGKNRCRYIDLLIQNLFVNSTKNQLASFTEGFEWMLVTSEWPGAFFQSLDPEDFDKMLGGSMGTLDVEDWRSRTLLFGYNQEDDQIKWFWMAVEGMTDEQRRRLLFFWTSLECLPVGGFAGMKPEMLISRAAYQTSDHLPSSSTCMNRLSLPCYTSFSMTQSRLGMIIQEHMCSGFGEV